MKYANEFLQLINKTPIRPTYFELLIALAYWVFKKEEVNYAVIETGLGGLVDGTNVVQRPDKVCVITDIGLDHTKILGETVQLIAAQKAGIIQPHNVVFVQPQEDTILDVIKTFAAKKQAPVHTVGTVAAPIELPLFQQRNWKLAKTVFDYVAQRDGLPQLTAKQRASVARQTPPGRFESITLHGKTVILDGAHNPQKLLALRESLQKTGITQLAVVANFTQAPDYKIEAMLEILQPIVAHLIIPEFKSRQDIRSRLSLKASELKIIATQHGFKHVTVCTDVPKAFEMLMQLPGTPIVTGSLYLVSFVKRYLHDKYKII